MKLLYAANAGMLIDTGKNAIGVDLFCRDFQGLYRDTPESLKESLFAKIESGEIGTLLFTHEHGDHFYLPDVLEALQRNPDLLIISTEEVLRLVRGQESRRGKLWEIEKALRENVTVSLPGFQLELFNSPHQGEEYADVQNLVCMMEAEGKKILMPGDAWPKPELFARVREWSESLDWLVAPFPFVGLPSVRRMIDRNLKVGQILAVHLPRPEKDSQGWIQGAKKVCMRAKDGLPAAAFAEIPGEEYK